MPPKRKAAADKDAPAKKPKAKKVEPPVVTAQDPAPRQPPPAKPAFKVVSWNVDGLRAKGRKEMLTKIAAEEKPDLICLQETKLNENDTALWEECLPGYKASFAICTEKKGYSGTAMYVKTAGGGGGGGSGGRNEQKTIQSFFAKKKPKAAAESSMDATEPSAAVLGVTFGIGDAEQSVAIGEGRAITVEYAGFYVVNLCKNKPHDLPYQSQNPVLSHRLMGASLGVFPDVPNSGRKLERLDYRVSEWDVALRKYVVGLQESKPVVVTGDLNVAHSDIDIYNYFKPHLKKTSGCTQRERESMTAYLAETNSIDVFRHFHPESKAHYTFWSQMTKARGSNSGLRLDYFLCSKVLMVSVASIACRGHSHCLYTTPPLHGTDAVALNALAEWFAAGRRRPRQRGGGHARCLHCP